MVKRLRKYRFLNCLLVSLFIGFYVSNTLFVHTHYYQGYSITHSHPYAKNTDGLPDHTHTANDLRVISAFNASVFFAAETVTVDDVCRIPVAGTFCLNYFPIPFFPGGPQCVLSGNYIVII